MVRQDLCLRTFLAMEIHRDRGIRLWQELVSHLPPRENPDLFTYAEFAGSEPSFHDLMEHLPCCFSSWSVLLSCEDHSFPSHANRWDAISNQGTQQSRSMRKGVPIYAECGGYMFWVNTILMQLINAM